MMAAASTAATDEQLVAAIRAGGDEALEALFLRYRDRITAYVRGIVPDQGRAEDIVQETFISALRSLRSTDREIAFRPWVYQIARNACIDHLRRQKRAQEVSIDSDDFKSQDERRISQAGQSTHGAASQREDMRVLRQAFGGLPASQHEILVLRELEGLSYAEIASRMGLSPAAVESMLFRARRGLKFEYDEIATGERCRRMQAVVAAVAEGLGGARDRRELARHVRFCSGCRHEAITMGLDRFVIEALRRSRFRKALDKAAALFPIPPFLHRRFLHRGGGGAADASVLERLSARVQVPLSSLGVAGSPAAEQAAGVIPKAVAVVATAALIGAGGLVGEKSGGASASASPPAGGSALVNGPGFSSQAQPGAGSGGPGAAGVLGSGGGLTRSADGPFSGQIVAAPGPGGIVGLGGGIVGLGAPSGPDGPGGAAGPVVERILGAGPISLGGAGQRSVPKDTTGPPSAPGLGGITLPPALGGDSPSAGGGNGPVSGVKKLVPEVPRTPPVLQNPTLPSAPNQPTVPSPSVPALPTVPQLPPVTNPAGGALQGVGSTTPQLPLTLP